MNEQAQKLMIALVKLQGSVKLYGRDHDEALGRYVDELMPFGPYAFRAVEAGPREHDVWPAMKELIDESRNLQNLDRARTAVDAATTGQTPVAKFINAVSKSPAGGDKYVSSWLNPTVNCAFTNREILTTRVGVERLKRDWGKLLILNGVQVEYDPIQDERLSIHVEGLYRDGKLRRPA